MPVHLHLSSVLKRTRLSNRWERQVLETGNLGYVGSRKVVCPVVPSLSLVDSPCRDAWAKHKDLDSYEAKWLYVDALLKVSSTCGCASRRG